MPETTRHKDCEQCIFNVRDLCGNCDLILRDKTGIGNLRTYPGAKPCCDCVKLCAEGHKLAEGRA